MRTMIVITGLTCSGKTYMVDKLKRRYKWESIHTDSFYFPFDGNKPNSKVGVDDELKRKYFEENAPVGDIFIIEGCHAGNQKELDLYKRYLGFHGNIIIFEARSIPDNFEKWFAVKYSSHSEDLETQKKKLKEHWQSIYDVEVNQVVHSWREINRYIRENNVYISR